MSEQDKERELMELYYIMTGKVPACNQYDFGLWMKGRRSREKEIEQLKDQVVYEREEADRVGCIATRKEEEIEQLKAENQGLKKQVNAYKMLTSNREKHQDDVVKSKLDVALKSHTASEWKSVTWTPPPPKTVLVELLVEDARRYAECRYSTMSDACRKALGWIEK